MTPEETPEETPGEEGDRPATDAATSYVFPVEVEVLGDRALDALTERVYEALARELDALG